MARIEESPYAPHEVLLPGATRIPVRRADTTVAASLDEIERLIRRRDGLRSESARTVDVEFFRDLFVEVPNGLGEQLIPPTLGVKIRPRTIGGLGLAFDSRLDRMLREMALTNEVAPDLRAKPMPTGLVLDDSERGTPNVRLEVHGDGTIRSGRALSVESKNQAGTQQTGPGIVEDKWLDFAEIAWSLCAMVRFAANVYVLERPGVEMEVWFGLSDYQGHRTTIPVKSPFHSYTGEMPGGALYRQPVVRGAVVRTGWEDGNPAEEDLLALVREISRFFGISAPDDRLRFYLY